MKKCLSKREAAGFSLLCPSSANFSYAQGGWDPQRAQGLEVGSKDSSPICPAPQLCSDPSTLSASSFQASLVPTLACESSPSGCKERTVPLQPRDDEHCFSEGSELDLLRRDRSWLSVRSMRTVRVKSRICVNIEMSGSQALPQRPGYGKVSMQSLQRGQWPRSCMALADTEVSCEQVGSRGL